MSITKPRGTRDFLPEDMEQRRYIESIMRDIVKKWGYREIMTPTFEHLDLFTLKSGETIVDELYNFTDKGNREMALRPELTAPVMRMYTNELQATSKPLKLYYFENCFRYERPQKGRYREFWQFGVELIGSKKEDADAEVIALAMSILDAIKVNGTLNVGHLGVIRHILKELDTEHQSNIMRYVDKKDDTGLDDYLENINATASLRRNLFELISIQGDDALEKAKEVVGDIEELQYFKNVLNILDIYEIPYNIDFGIARGLDYYTGIVFEIYADNLGAQNQVCGGGSYQLIKLFGGGDVPSTGFGIGFDRLMQICDLVCPKPKNLMIISTDNTRSEAIKIGQRLREIVPTQVDLMHRNFKAQLSHANNIGADHVLIVGEKELELGKFTLKDMNTGYQETIHIDDIIDRLTS
ncbi:histidine--tRNA ligase [Methanosalsum natronophilum]|uniref:Histidine--tRNA ligase n=1 Tax=Methanosalsum natronophilum TaxID=768733 RepID=A0A3R7X3X5_9EURY|nr:histidine--tRNA ligase [Methanosalsum natronophilum]MCS3923340.1 histidyl-tRNA synthetase [Methanosalsum natronophilum]RQD81187.1 MAG: histidine--tRNA ligase [Methanosalsum natronophilum]